ncbi:MAG TPA: hypothetical protein VGG75_14255 [Trebonia sp.]
MSTPEPLDERPAGAVEIRGGDKPEDFIPGPGFRTGSVEELLGKHVPYASCDCGCEDGSE